MNDKKKNSKLLYVIIVLLVALVAVGSVSFLTALRLSSLQTQIKTLKQVAADLSSTSDSLHQKAEEFQEQEEPIIIKAKHGIRDTGEIAGPFLPTATPTIEASVSSEDTSAEATTEPTVSPSEGTLSPSTGSTFTQEEDDSMNSLLSQVQNLLPQSNGVWSVYVCNLQSGMEGAINEQPMQAASLIKLFIMGAVYENYDALAKQYGTDSLDSNLRSMITVSDNDAANTLIEYLGGGDTSSGMSVVNSFCKAHGYTGTSMGRLLLASNASSDNYTTVTDCGRFLTEIYQVCNGNTSSQSLAHADAMYALLKQQELRNKIPALIPDGVGVANKTGELDTVENDAAIIYDTAKGVDLVVVFMAQSLTDTSAAQTNIAENARRIYGFYNE